VDTQYGVLTSRPHDLPASTGSVHDARQLHPLLVLTQDAFVGSGPCGRRPIERQSRVLPARL